MSNETPAPATIVATLASLAVLLAACGSDITPVEVGADQGSTPAPAPAPSPAPSPSPGPSPVPPEAVESPTVSIDSVGTLLRSQSRGFALGGRMSADTDHVYATLYNTPGNQPVQQWQLPVYDQSDRTQWSLTINTELQRGTYRLEVLAGRGEMLSRLQSMTFDVIIDEPVPTVLSCARGYNGGRYNWSNPVITESQHWVYRDGQNQFSYHGNALAQSPVDLASNGGITELENQTYHWEHTESTTSYSGTRYTLSFTRDGQVLAASSTEFASVALVVTSYTSCIPAGDNTGQPPGSPTINPVGGDDLITPNEQPQPHQVTGTGQPNATIFVNTSSGFSADAHVRPDGTWRVQLGPGTLNLPGTGITLSAVQRYNQQNSAPTSREVVVQGD